MARCNICRKVYSRGSLARHQIIHTGQKSYECNQCGKAFYQKSDLQRHEVNFLLLSWTILILVRGGNTLKLFFLIFMCFCCWMNFL
jgi:uncharacterized Zn-finger protein